MKKLALLAALLAGAATALPAHAAGENNLRVIATNVKSDAGSLYVWVYDKKDDWLSDRFRTQAFVKVAGHRTGDRVTVELLLPAGDYALSVFQDVNDNGKLERNFIGIPKEPAGLSNNLRPKFGPPKYKDAVFTVAKGVVAEQKIELQ
ncbi:MAG: DUF2141 domain-containing protein [Gammaproteobacteria bacterium]|jgi:uncharacterized protein (DUF2141 family)|nr:DUF2141 domain-containing protein [Gammaproteobacteria bacterium]